MKYEKGLLFEFDKKQYIILEDLVLEGIHYCFCNEFINDEPTETYIFFKEVNNDLEIVDNMEEVEKIVPYAENLLKNDLEKGE